MAIQFTKGERWLLDGTSVLFDQALTSDYLLFLHENTLKPLQVESDEGYRTPDMSWALEAYASGRLTRRPDTKACAIRRLAAEREYDPATIKALDPWARLRLFVLRQLDQLGLHKGSERAIDLALGRIWQEKPEAQQLGNRPSARSAIRWLKRGEPGQRTLQDAFAMTGRVPRPKRHDAQVQRLMARWVRRYWQSPAMNKTTAYARFAVRAMRLSRWRVRAGLDAIKTPAFETFRQRILESENYETYALKFGKKKAASRFKAVGGMMTAQRCLQLGCMDHTLLDAVAVLDTEWMLPIGSPWLTVLIDVMSRCVVGFVLSFEPPSIYSVMECLKRAGTPKVRFTDESGPARHLVNVFGRFDEIVVDNGKEFAGLSFEDALSDLGTTLRLAPVASPTHKAIVERFFGTLNHLVTRQLPGAKLPPHVLRELGYDPAANAVLTVEQIEELIWEAIRLYHLEIHSGTGMAPGAVWHQDAQRYGIPVHNDLRQLDKMLGTVAEGRQLSRSGIEIHGLRYHDASVVQKLLNDLVGTAPATEQRRSGSGTCRVKVKFNPANLAEIHVWNHRDRRYYTLKCLDERYAQGMSLWHHRKLKEWAKAANLAFATEEDRLAARSRLAAKVEQLIPDVMLRKRRTVARVIKAPTQEPLQGVVEMRFAPSRHDGMAPIIDQTPLAFSRTDDGLASSRPSSRKKSTPAVKRTKKTPTAKPLPPPNSFGTGSNGLDWRGFQ